ncbi:MAG: patatin-like phospholipase family protein [Pseudomonadota bacterium]
MSSQDSPAPKAINLALQGGGAHGAFTWGVLNRLLREDRIAITAVSGASAGAMNAVVLADGLEAGGAKEARRQLDQFWTSVSQDGGLASNVDEIVDAMSKFWHVPGFEAWGAMASAENMATMMSPLGLVPLELNPLGALLEEIVDFDRIRKAQAVQLFIAATNVRTGRGRIFINSEITTKAVLASAALPHLFRAVEIDGVPYWDGGYVANPPLWPFYEGDSASDVVLIQVNPKHRNADPTSSLEIAQRENEIMFNAALIKELRSIFFLDYLLDKGALDPAKFSRKRLHLIDGTRALSQYGDASKMDTSLPFFETLKKAGEAAASHWLEQHIDDLGVRSTVDLHRDFQLGPFLDHIHDFEAGPGEY